MGCIDTITYDKFPKQKDKNYKYPQFKVGSRVKVCYHYDTLKYHYGTIVRDDLEEPFETIIKLDNGRYLRATECQFSYVDEEISDDVCEWRLDDDDQWHTGCRNKIDNMDNEVNTIEDYIEHTRFNYCPFCRKKIKVVGNDNKS